MSFFNVAKAMSQSRMYDQFWWNAVRVDFLRGGEHLIADGGDLWNGRDHLIAGGEIWGNIDERGERLIADGGDLWNGRPPDHLQ